MNGNLRIPAAILGISLALGIAAAGAMVAKGLYEARSAQRFVTVRGLAAEEMSTIVPRLTDMQAQMPGQETRPGSRYLAEAALTLRTPRVDEMRLAMQDSGELVSAGIVLVRSWEYQPQYLFTGLDAIKPDMIAAATRDARSAAQQFAADSGSRVGSIRNAQQGYFSISDRDPFSPEFKTVRVVTTVEYFLVD